MNAAQHKTLVNEVLYSSGLLDERIRYLYPNLFIQSDHEDYIDYQHDTKWQEMIFNNSMFTNFNVMVKGATKLPAMVSPSGTTTTRELLRRPEITAITCVLSVF